MEYELSERNITTHTRSRYGSLTIQYIFHETLRALHHVYLPLSASISKISSEREPFHSVEERQESRSDLASQ